MQTILEFRGTLKGSGEVKTQRVPMDKQEVLQDPIKTLMYIQSVLVQLGVGGMVHKEGDEMVLTPGENFSEIRCSVPSIVIATPGEDIDPGR